MAKCGILFLLVIVLAGCPVRVEVNMNVAAITLGVGQQFTLSVSSTDDADAPFTWAVDDPSVVALNADTGLNVTITALNPGLARVTVTGSNSGVTATAVISVPVEATEELPETPVSVSVAPASLVFEVGGTVPLSASSTSADDTDFSWRVGDESILTLSADAGVSVEATALTTGVTTVTATGIGSGLSATAVLSAISSGDVVMPVMSPGLNITIAEVTIPEDRRPEVTFFAATDLGEAVSLVEFTTAQFLMAHLDPAPAAGNSSSYISYNTRTEAPEGLAPETQATYDAAGLAGLSGVAGGMMRYKFATALPEDYDLSATHAVGGQFRRSSLWDGKVYVANAVHEFRPDGAAVVHTREIVSTASCNDCHTRLSFHGDVRRDVRLCILCHNPGSTDANTGNTVDMAVMIHKIHLGKDLPSVQAGEPYQLVGFRDAVHDYSTVAYPQDIRNCTSCHRQDEGLAQADFYLTKPTQAACGSCHDRVWFGEPVATPEGYYNHPLDFAQDDDRMCAVCHPPHGPGMAPVREAHLTVAERPENPGLSLEITEIRANPDTGALEIDFAAAYGDGSPITSLEDTANVGAIVAWPAWEYEDYYSESILGSDNLVSAASATGEYTYVFANQLPTNPGLSFGIVMTGRTRFDANGRTYTQGLTDNSLHFFTIDGSEPVMRRAIVDEMRCNDCHNEVRFHGEQRVGVDACVMCHHTSATDAARRPSEAMPPETVNFKDMIHRIHRGKDLERGYTAYGFGNVAHDYSTLRFPGRLEQCSICHGENPVNLPLPDFALPTVVGDAEPVFPERAACVSCHDSLMTNIHAVLATDVASGIESCVVCHGASASQAVALAHTLTP